MPSIFMTPAAEIDLINIWLYIARDKPEAADRVYQAAADTFKILLATPRIGALYHCRRPLLKGIRFVPITKFQNYIIYYREQPSGIEIIRVLYGRMDQGRYLEPDECRINNI